MSALRAPIGGEADLRAGEYGPGTGEGTRPRGEMKPETARRRVTDRTRGRTCLWARGQAGPLGGGSDQTFGAHDKHGADGPAI